MLVTCDMKDCFFWDKRGFCSKVVVSINEFGFCKELYKKNMPRYNVYDKVDQEIKNPIIIEEQEEEQKGEKEK